MFHAYRSATFALLVLSCSLLTLACAPTIQHHSSPVRTWGTPTERYEGCCQTQAKKILHPSPEGAEVRPERDLIREALERSPEALERLRHRSIQDKLRAFRAQREKYEAERKTKKKTESTVVLNVSASPSDKQSEKYCADLYPEAKYMTPPDEEGTSHWIDKRIEDFSDFASCFHERYGGAFGAEDFRSCNSIPNVSETERAQCLSEERPDPQQWCWERFFDNSRDVEMWRQCVNEFAALEDRDLLEPDIPKTPEEMRQDEEQFIANASSSLKDEYRSCILQMPRQTDEIRQQCRDFARGTVKLLKALRVFSEGLEEEPRFRAPAQMPSPENTY